MKNDWIVSFDEQENSENVPCKLCDCIDQVCCFTQSGQGPFCLECFESLCDPDQALLLDQRLKTYEEQLMKLRSAPLTDEEEGE